MLLNAALGLALRSAVVSSGCGRNCLICVGKSERDELWEKAMQLCRLCFSFLEGGSRGSWLKTNLSVGAPKIRERFGRSKGL